MPKVRPWCGQPSDRGRLMNRTVLGFRKDQKDLTKSTPLVKFHLFIDACTTNSHKCLLCSHCFLY